MTPAPLEGRLSLDREAVGEAYPKVLDEQGDGAGYMQRIRANREDHVRKRAHGSPAREDFDQAAVPNGALHTEVRQQGDAQSSLGSFTQSLAVVGTKRPAGRHRDPPVGLHTSGPRLHGPDVGLLAPRVVQAVVPGQ